MNLIVQAHTQSSLPYEVVVEVWHEGRFLATLYADKDKLRLISKFEIKTEQKLDALGIHTLEIKI